MNIEKYKKISNLLYINLIENMKKEYSQMVDHINNIEGQTEKYFSNIKFSKIVNNYYNMSLKTINLNQLRNVLESFEEKYINISKKHDLIEKYINKILFQPLKRIRKHQLYLIYNEETISKIDAFLSKNTKDKSKEHYLIF